MSWQSALILRDGEQVKDVVTAKKGLIWTKEVLGENCWRFKKLWELAAKESS